VSKAAPFSGLGEEHKRESPLTMRERWGLIGRISTRFNIVRSHVERQFWYWIYCYICNAATNKDDGPVAAPQWGRSARILVMPLQLRALKRLRIGFP
jgi:hypothetical protein